ncbi:hypothetical protein EXIGLDRAFT_724713 [Exidia glandulosa HHB12029]|uniref:Uncharacterized protein n=1 Tax=Exidia glandulosa HHB12029 TaxID=1314781 RepID=A0A165EB19_EXIGL|nr:hypothetical protein EXIGLDRAFT_724713 [Exidia glandulosa HHB12029]
MCSLSLLVGSVLLVASGVCWVLLVVSGVLARLSCSAALLDLWRLWLVHCARCVYSVPLFRFLSMLTIVLINMCTIVV